MTNNDDLRESSEEQRDRYLTFRLENTHCGIDIRYILEIIGMQNITPVPDTPEYIRGMINLRGTIIPVMDVRLRFHMPFKPYDDRTCIVVVSLNNVSVGLIIDHVSEVAEIAPDQIEQPPGYSKADNAYMMGVAKTGGTIKLLLDCERLLYEKDTAMLARAVEGSAS